jgi:hypothetical protein
MTDLSPRLNIGTNLRSDTATVSEVASSATSVTIVSANEARKGLIIVNDSTQILYIRFGSGAASTTDYTRQIAASGGEYEVPYGYQGQITGIWVLANGQARLTELT